VLWPVQLCFDYGWPEDHVFKGLVYGGAAEFLAVVIVVFLCGITLFALWQRKPSGFLGVWFLGILAPTSSILPLYSIAAEHRMYLPVISVIVLLVVGVYRFSRYLWSKDPAKWQTCCNVGLFFVVMVTVIFGMLTFSRNRDYRSRVSLWADTVHKIPGNSRARQNLGTALVDEGREAEGVLEYMEALRLRPGDAGTHVNLGIALSKLGRNEEATFHYRKALEIKPDEATAHSNLGILLARNSQVEQAILHFQKALFFLPDYVEAHNNLGYAYYLTGHFHKAKVHFKKALEIDPRFFAAAANLKLLDKEKRREKENGYGQAGGVSSGNLSGEDSDGK
jgi:tetratricopeptide (TPR) repeat protein